MGKESRIEVLSEDNAVAVHKRMYRDASLMVETVTNLDDWQQLR